MCKWQGIRLCAVTPEVQVSIFLDAKEFTDNERRQECSAGHPYTFHWQPPYRGCGKKPQKGGANRLILSNHLSRIIGNKSYMDIGTTA